MRDLNIVLPYTIPGKATGGWAVPKQDRRRIQETKDPIQHRKGVKRDSKETAQGSHKGIPGNRCARDRGQPEDLPEIPLEDKGGNTAWDLNILQQNMEL